MLHTSLRTWLISIALPLLLLLGQQAAFAHDISHLADQVPYSQDQTTPEAGLCQHCLAFSQLNGAVPSTIQLLPHIAVPHTLFVRHIPSAASQQAFIAYISRAPPIFSLLIN